MVKGDLISDFLSIMKLDKAMYIDVNIMNESLDTIKLEFLRRFNMNHPVIVDGKYNSIRGNILPLLKKVSRKGGRLLHPKIQKEIHDELELSNKRVAQEYLQKNTGTLFLSPILEKEKWNNEQQENETITVEDVVNICCELWALKQEELIENNIVNYNPEEEVMQKLKVTSKLQQLNRFIWSLLIGLRG